MRLDYQSFKAGLSISFGFLALYKVAANFHIRSYLCKSFFIQSLNFYSLGIIFEGRTLGKITFLSEYPHADKRRLEKKRTLHILFKVYLLNNKIFIDAKSFSEIRDIKLLKIFIFT
jgi:hypothetical protein